MGKTILVTGGAGYIGSHTIIDLLETTDYEVISVDNYANSSSETFDRIEKITGKRIKNYAIDLCNKEQTKEVFKQHVIDGIIHFAAFKSVPESVENPLKYYHNNIQSLLNIIELAEIYACKNLIFSSSCSVYGNIEKMPVTEDTPLNKAVSPYAYTKQIGERILEDYTKSSDKLNIISLRYFNPAGAHKSGLIGEVEDEKTTYLIPVISKHVTGKLTEIHVNGDQFQTRDGSAIRDYIHIMDLAAAHVLAIDFLFNQKNVTKFDVFNLGTDKGVSVLEAIQETEKITNIKVTYKIGPARFGDVEAIYSDSTKAKNVLNWNTKHELKDIIKSAIDWEKVSK